MAHSAEGGVSRGGVWAYIQSLWLGGQVALRHWPATCAMQGVVSQGGVFGGADQMLQQPNFSAQLSEALTRAGYDIRMG